MKHPLFIRVTRAFRLPQWLLNAMAERTKLGDVTRTEMIETAVCKTYKFKKPTAKELEDKK